MSKQTALNAYRDSLYDAAVLEFSMRANARSLPLIGGLWTGLKLLGNFIFRPIKVGAALVLGYDSKHAEFPPMPEIPAAFKDTQLATAFEQSWPLNKEAADAKVRSFGKLLKLDFIGSWQEASVAAYAEAKENNVVFVDEAVARAQASGRSGGSGFVEMLSSSKGTDISR